MESEKSSVYLGNKYDCHNEVLTFSSTVLPHQVLSAFVRVMCDMRVKGILLDLCSVHCTISKYKYCTGHRNAPVICL
jgi:hypothetical protein